MRTDVLLRPAQPASPRPKPRRSVANMPQLALAAIVDAARPWEADMAASNLQPGNQFSFAWSRHP
jgi:hypothetical protein